MTTTFLREHRMRVRAILTCWSLFALARGAGAQQRGTMEFGAFGSAASFDHSLTLDTGFGAGARVGMYVVPRLSLEFEESVMRSTRTLGLRDVNVAIISARATGVAYRNGAWSLLGGAGAGVSTETNFLHAYGVDALAGVKYDLNPTAALRVDGVWDWLSDGSWKSYRTLRVGISVYRHPKP